MSCTHCGRPLHKAQWTDDEKWKSCPRCSQHHGGEHVFRRFPDAFGTTPARAGRAGVLIGQNKGVTTKRERRCLKDTRKH